MGNEDAKKGMLYDVESGVIEFTSGDMDAIIGYDENAATAQRDSIKCRVAEIFGDDEVLSMQEDNLILSLLRMGIMDLDKRNGVPMFILKRGALSEFIRIILTDLDEEDFKKFFPNEFGIDLSNKAITDEDLRFFEESDRLVGLKALDLSYCKLSGQGIKKLSQMSCFSNLNYLDLSGNNIGGEGLKALLNSNFLQKIEALKLSNCGIEKLYTSRDFDFSALRSMTTLDLSRNNLGDSDIPTLFSGESACRIKNLDLGGNFISKTSVLISQCGLFKNLERLSLRSNNIDTDDAILFARLCDFSNLKSLDLSSNRILSNALSELGMNLNSDLEELLIADNEINFSGALYIASLPGFLKLKRLDLSRNPIRNEGLEIFAFAKCYKTLEQLEISECGITDEGFKSFCLNGNFPGLRTLDISNSFSGVSYKCPNRIGKAGFSSLLISDRLPGLKSLNASENNLGGDELLEIFEKIALKYGLEYLGIKFGDSNIEVYRKLAYLTDQGLSIEC